MAGPSQSLASQVSTIFLYTIWPLDSSVDKESDCNAGDHGLIPGLGRSTGEGIGYSLQYSWASLFGSAREESTCNVGRPGFNPWVGKIPWRMVRLPAPVFWPGQFHGLLQSMGSAKSWTLLSDFHFHMAPQMV